MFLVWRRSAGCRYATRRLRGRTCWFTERYSASVSRCHVFRRTWVSSLRRVSCAVVVRRSAMQCEHSLCSISHKTPTQDTHADLCPFSTFCNAKSECVWSSWPVSSDKSSVTQLQGANQCPKSAVISQSERAFHFRRGELCARAQQPAAHVRLVVSRRLIATRGHQR